MNENPYPTIAVAGNGAIATGLAALAACESDVIVLVRSREAVGRAGESLDRACRRVEGADRERISLTVDSERLTGADLVVEAVIEDLDAKSKLLRRIGEVTDGDLASTTSSLSIGELGDACGHPDRLFGLHVFNPVPVMKLVELCLPDTLADGIGGRAREWCEHIGKTWVETPDTAGFAVNRLLFPYLFDAVRYQERTGLEPADVDTCMTLGVAHPMGPLALLDLVGLDVAIAIGQAIHRESGNPEHLAPASVVELVAGGHLGRKTGRGFYEYD
ncbi:MAG: 3-hydroxyacyl-CoA dehydrogenase NAD-binding domain-containing protein [Solirubrobacterales bacterium]|nr:3-hydroxyacyl-CoA dehydrogenase NAD-binding domain-containing protein [Solirubrobacterales bacterium]